MAACSDLNIKLINLVYHIKGDKKSDKYRNDGILLDTLQSEISYY